MNVKRLGLMVMLIAGFLAFFVAPVSARFGFFKPKFSIKVIENTDQCLLHVKNSCYAILEIEPNFDFYLTKGFTLRSDAKLYKPVRVGNQIRIMRSLFDPFSVNAFDLYYLKNVSYVVEQPVYGVCNNTYNVTNTTNFTLPSNCWWLVENESYACNESCVVGYENVTKYATTWEKLTFPFQLHAYEPLIVKVVFNPERVGLRKFTRAGMEWGLTFSYNFFDWRLGPWFNSSWQYRRPIIITEQSGQNLTNYQVKLNITYDTDMKPDFSDLRFTYYNESDGSEIEIPYYFEEVHNESYAVTWVKVPFIPANGNATIYVYYGNPNATYIGNISAVFDYYSDFCTDDGMWVETSSTGLFTIDTTNCYMQIGGSSTTTVRLNKVFDPYNPGYEAVYSVLFDTTNTANNHNIMGTFLRPDTWAYGVTAPIADVMSKVHVNPAYDYAILKGPSYAVGSYSYATISPFNDGNWHTIIFRHTKDYVNSTVVGIASQTHYNSTYANDIRSDSNDYYFFFVAEVGAVKIDYLRIRKYTDPEPTYTIGEEEVSNLPPQINDVKIYRATKQDYTLSYCGSDTATLFTSSLTVYLNSTNPSVDNYLFVRRIKNTGTITVYFNGVSYGTLSSTTGTDCNGNLWVVDRVKINASDVNASNNEIYFTCTGDNCYIDYVALTPIENISLISNVWDVMLEANVTNEYNEPFWVNITGLPTDMWQSGNTTLFYLLRNAPEINGVWQVQVDAIDNASLTSTATFNFTVDSDTPVNSLNYSYYPIIEFNQVCTPVEFNASASDWHIDYWQVFVDLGGATIYSSIYNVTNDSVDLCQAGIYTLKLYSVDLVGHSNTTTFTLPVTDVDMTTTETTNYLDNSILFGDGTENAVKNVLATFWLKHSITTQGFVNATAHFFYTPEVTNFHNATLDCANYTITNGTVYWNISVVVNNSYTCNMKVEAENISLYWQNDAVDNTKRYFRVYTNFEYNYTLPAQIIFILPVPYDPTKEHPELYECSNPSTIERYGCDGTWDLIKQTGCEINGTRQYVCLNTTLSTHLWFARIVDGAEGSSENGDGTVASVGGGGVVVVQDQPTEPEKPLPTDLGGILLKPLIPGMPYVNILNIGLAFTVWQLLFATGSKKVMGRWLGI